MDWNSIKVIAVVGASANKHRDSYEVMKYFIEKGFEVVPINPKYDEIDGIKCYNNILDIPERIAGRIDMVDIFRRSEFVYPIVQQAVELKKRYGNLKVIWMQLGVYDEKSYNLAVENGLEVVANACAMMSHKRDE